MYSLDILLLQGGGLDPATAQFILIGGILLVFWLFMIRPQAKKQKEQRNFMNDIEKGDEVVTASGILGRINKIEDDIVTLEVGTKTFIRVTRDAISKELTERIFKSEAS